MTTRWNLKQVRAIVWGTWGIGLVLCLVNWWVQNLLLAILTIVVVLGALVFQFIAYRCPHCGKYLGQNAGAFCHYCGGSLDE